jgi:hypothetical protein
MVGGAGCAVITMIAFVCAVNAAIWIDAQVGDVAKVARNICACLAGGGARDRPAAGRSARSGCVAADAGHRHRRRRAAGAGNVLEFDLASVLYTVWQAGIAVEPVTTRREPVCRYHANCNLFPVRAFKKIGTEGAERCYFVGQHLRN